MLVFWKERLVYLATPKTGSTAIEAALGPLASVAIQRPPVLKHTSVRRYWQSFAPFLEKAADERFTVVAMMREPVDWLGSWYRYRQRDGIRKPENSTKGLSFDAFVDAYLSKSRPPYADVGRQGAFLAPEGTRGADRIFQYERIEGLVDFLEDRLDCEIVLPRLNVSPPGTVALSPDTEARLREKLAEDFALHASLA
jgi:Sulfotransferase family